MIRRTIAAAALIAAVAGSIAFPGNAHADTGVPIAPDYATAQATHEGCLTVLDDTYTRFLAVVAAYDADAALLGSTITARETTAIKLAAKVDRQAATIARLRARLANR